MDENTLSAKNKKALKVLQMISKGTLYGGVLEVAKFLKLPGYFNPTKLLMEPF